MDLLIGILEPGNNIKHKLGYGLAFGMGSIDIKITNIMASAVEAVFDQDESYQFTPGIAEGNDYVDPDAFKWLRQILSFDKLLDLESCIYTYPSFDENNFKKTVQWNVIQKITTIGGDDHCLMNDTVAKSIAKALYTTKKTIHFRHYQEMSDFWKQIISRR